MKIILLNGPPGCGKDTIAGLIEDLRRNVIPEKFARPIKEAIPPLYGISKATMQEMDSPECKDNAQEALLGETPRNVQIAISENLLKPLHGNEVFGRLCASRIAHHRYDPEKIVVVSDCGFFEEAAVLTLVFNEVELWQITRPGTSFANDSRSYIDSDALGIPTRQITNAGDMDQLYRKVKRMLEISEGME